jgi:uncharacterized membrane protein YccC
MSNLGSGAEPLPDRELRRLQPHPFADLLRLQPGRPALAVGLRMAIVISVPMMVGASVGQLGPATTVCLGALNGGMADVGGARSSRWHALGAAMVLDALAISLGTLAGQSIWLAVPLMFVVAVACGLANLFGNVAANVGFVVVILYMVGVGAPGGGSVAFERLWLTLLGGAWAIVVVLVIWPVRPFEAVSKGLAETCSSLAGLVRTVASPTGVEDVDRSQASADAHRVRDSIESTRSDLVLVRGGRRGESAMAQRLLLVLREIRRVLNAVEDLGADSTAAEGQSQGVGLPASLSGELPVVAGTIEVLGDSIAHLDTSPPDPSVTAGLTAGIDAWESRVRGAAVGGAGADIERRSATAALLQVAASLRTMTGLVDTTSETGADSMAATSESGQLGLGATGDRPGFPAVQRARLLRVVATLRANMTLDSMVARHALRYGTTTAVGLIIAMAADLTKGYWITLTIAVVLRPFVAATLSRAVLRVAGTVLGAALTAVVVVGVTNTAELIALLFVLAVLAFSLMPLNYALGVVFLTPLVITLISLTSAGGWVLAEHRIVNTLIGGALALAGGYLLWPGGNRDELFHQLELSVRADRDFFDATIDAMGQEPGGRDYTTLLALHQHAGLALDNVVAKFQQTLGETRSRRGPLPVLWSMMESSRAVYLGTATIEQHVHVVERAQTDPAIGSFRSAVDDRLDALVAGLREGPPFPDAEPGGASPTDAEVIVANPPGIERAAGRITDALSDFRREVGELAVARGQGQAQREGDGHPG